MAALSDEHRLWVPMQMQTLVFGQPADNSDDKAFADLTPGYAYLRSRQAPLGNRLRPSLAGDSVETLLDDEDAFLKRGIHLHWNLPSAFSHVRLAPGGTAGSRLPAVPNRWLITRLHSTDRLDPKKLSRRCWIVESDLRENEKGTPWLEQRDGRFTLTTLGGAFDLNEWQESAEQRDPVTAFAPGNIGFAAFYPSCKGVFGFHDSAEDLPDQAVCTYLVAGWFADRSSDPLNVASNVEPAEKGLKPEERWSRRMAQLGWAVPENSLVWPTALTCCAVIQDITWTPNAPYAGVRPSGTRVSIGNSFIEAVAALANESIGSGPRDRLLGEFQLGLLAEQRPTRRDVTDGNFFQSVRRMIAAGARLHERSFSAQEGGTTWQVVRQSDRTGQDDAKAEPLAILPDDVSEALGELNRRQRSYDEGGRTLAARQSRLFLAWYQQQYWSTLQQEKPTDEDLNALGQDVKDAKADVESLALTTLHENLNTARSDLETKLKAQLPEAALVQRPMPRFWRAGDPFVVMSGMRAPAIQGGASPLQCRVSDQAITTATYGSGGSPVQVDRQDLARYLTNVGVLPIAGNAIAPHTDRLLVDIVFTDSDRAEDLARIHLLKTVSDPSRAEVNRIATLIRSSLTPLRAGGANAMSPTLSLEGTTGTALTSFLSMLSPASATPRPVYMVWTAGWTPYLQPADQPSSTYWDFTEGMIDYRPRQAASKIPPRTIESYTLLATSLERGLAASRQKFPQAHFQPVFAPLIELAGQSLMGLTAAFATQDVGPQLPPLIRDGGDFIKDPIASLIGDQYAVAPLPGERAAPPLFSPLRGGDLSLMRLWMVDSFGRVHRIIDSDAATKPLVGRTLVGKAPGPAHLAPRLVQPARLLLRWHSATDDAQEAIGDMRTSPICGFVVHNQLDRSLMIYGAKDTAGRSVGTLLGAVQAVIRPDLQESVIWSTVPVRPVVQAESARRTLTDADIPNPHLRNFVKGVLALSEAADGTAFVAFRALLDRLDSKKDRSMEQGLPPLLAGRPLALVRASLHLELDGLPWTDEGADAVIGAARQSRVASHISARFPVRLGDRRLGPDGLVGFFVDTGDDADYRRIRLSADIKREPEASNHAYFDDPGLAVTCNPQDKPVMLSMLMDTQLGVHVVSGILPANLVTVPQQVVARSLADLELPFLVAPVLGERVTDPSETAQRRMPLPTNADGEWTWVCFPDAKTAAKEFPVSLDTQASPSLFAKLALSEGWLRYRASKGQQ